MPNLRKFISVSLIAACLASSITPAAAQWGWGPGWGGGWGYGGGWGGGYGGWGGGYGGWGGGYGGYGYGGAMAGAAIAGMAIGAIAASTAQQNRYYSGGGYAQPPYYSRHRRVNRQRVRLCSGYQALYDDWGDFLGYQLVRYRC